MSEKITRRTFTRAGATRSRVEWDAEREEIVSPKEANALMDYEYREPWKRA